jgi:hypothetical protein
LQLPLAAFAELRALAGGLDVWFELTCNGIFDLAKVRSPLLRDFDRSTTRGHPVIRVKGKGLC